MKLSKSTLILFLSFSACSMVAIKHVQAQEPDQLKRAEFGIRFMPTFTSFEMKTAAGGVVRGNVRLGFGAGVLLGFNFSNHVGIQGELIYTSLSQKFTDMNVEHKINLRYVNIPLLFSLNSGKNKVINLNVVAGPQLGIRVGSSITTSGVSDVNNPSYAVLSVKKSDVGFAYGAGVDVVLN